MNIKIKVGCDLVNIKKFGKSLKRGKIDFLEKIFTASELANSHSAETLAGVFAAKEAVIKALELEVGAWRDVEIVKKESGRPEVRLAKSGIKIISHDISISHDGEYAFAAAVFLIN